MEERKYYQIGSLEKGIKILEAIIECGELTVTAAAARLGLNRASAHRFITTLRDLGYVRKNQHGNYEASFKMLELGMKQAGKFEIRRLAKPIMRGLAADFDETVNLGILNQDQVVYLDKVDSREFLRMDSGVGTSCHAYATALGKAMVAFLPEEERQAYVAGLTFTAMTPKTITSHEQFHQELARIRERGYAIDDEELALDLYCIAAPIFDLNGNPPYSLSISGPSRRIRNLKNLPERLLAATDELSRQLGYRGGRR